MFDSIGTEPTRSLRRKSKFYRRAFQRPLFSLNSARARSISAEIRS
jgi:hypothetical protein